jgi:hypothetical protein
MCVSLSMFFIPRQLPAPLLRLIRRLPLACGSARPEVRGEEDGGDCFGTREEEGVMLLQRHASNDGDESGAAGAGVGACGSALEDSKDLREEGMDPRREGDTTRGRILDESSIRELPWGVVMLLGGGFALAEASKVSGLAACMAKSLIGLQGLSPVSLLFVIVSIPPALPRPASVPPCCACHNPYRETPTLTNSGLRLGFTSRAMPPFADLLPPPNCHTQNA